MPITVTHEISRDDGGYINIGTLGNLGSDMKNAAGKAYSFWLRTVDSGNIIPLGFNWFNYTGMGTPYSLFQINSKWTTDYVGEAGSVNIFVVGNTSTGWAFWKATGVNFNDSQYHHHVMTWVGFSSNKPTQLDYYVDGVLTGGAWNDYSDGAVGTVVNYAQNVYMGCTQKTASNVLTDFASFRLGDFRIYDRGLSAGEVSEIYRLRGCDNIRRGLHSRYDFQTTPANTGYHGVAAILANDSGVTPTFNTDSVLQGIRKRIL